MSYILDALRRADAERQQGQVPGLHAAPAQAAADGARPGRSAWPWLALAAVVLAAALAWWLWWTSAAAPTRPVPAPAVPVVAAAPAPLPRVASAPEPAQAPLPIVVSAAPAPPVVAVSTPVAAKPLAERPVPPVLSVPLSSLPPDERRQLPALVPGGSVWSDSAASRFVILDGQVRREGDEVAPGLVLERIERKALVLRWKDRRVEVGL